MAKKRNGRKNDKRNSLTNKVVSLTIFLDAVFLVIVVSTSILMCMVNQNSSRDINAAYTNTVVLEAITDKIDLIQSDIDNLAIDNDIINYIDYLNQGGTPVLDNTSPSYEIYLSYLTKISGVLDYQQDELYESIYIATEENCSTGNDGCMVDEQGVVSDATYAISSEYWYTELGTKEAIFTAPYLNSNDEYIVSFIRKVYDRDNFLGYVGIDVQAAKLAELLNVLADNNLPEESEVIVFIDIYDDPRLVYLSDESSLEYFMLSSNNYSHIDQLSGFNDQGVDYVLDSFSLNESQILVLFNNGSYVVNSTNLEDSALSVVTMYHIDQLIGFEIMFAVLMGISAIMVLAITIITSQHVKKSLSPIDTIMEAIADIKQGEYNKKVKISGIKEFKKIGDSITELSVEIDKKIKKTYEILAFDVLTGLKNRSSSAAELNATIFKSEKRSAVCLLQIDNLKNINVTKGQIIGDNLIKAIADELRHAFRSDETLFSNGGNEFVYIKENIHSLEEVEFTLNRLLAHFKEGRVVKKIRAEIKLNVGIAVYPTDGQTLDELIKKCDTALFKATEASNKKIIFYNEKISRSVSYQAEISEQLSNAIKNEQIYLKYQPLVTNDSEIYGFEALARWTSPTLGEIGPQVFIANAEESYLIIPIGTWILRQSCLAQVALKKRYQQEYVMSVNVSPVQILQKDFVEIVKKIVRETDINPEYLTLELTESLFIEATVILEDTIEQLHKMGIKLSLDDFGTGYASLTYLRQINFDNLKIDKTFVDGIFANIKDHRIIGTIVNLVHDLDMKVIAEGVETRKQYEYLKEIQTDVFQGYIFSKPLAIDKLQEFIEKFNDVPSYKRADVFASLGDE